LTNPPHEHPTHEHPTAEHPTHEHAGDPGSGPDKTDEAIGPDLDRRGADEASGTGPDRRGPRGRGSGRGGGHRGRGHGPGGHRARRGEVRDAVVTLLAEGSKHGYQILQELAERSGGSWSPSPGSIYPILHRLAAAGLVKAEKVEDGRRVFTLTDDGRVMAERIAAAGEAPWTTIGRGESDEARELRHLVLQLDGAVGQVAQVATTEQLVRASAIVAESRRRLYALLAEEPTEPG
jgi:DNA-binding PadR family transcriptional regulator